MSACSSTLPTHPSVTGPRPSRSVLPRLLAALLTLALVAASAHVADAKRFGGGGSFGSKPSYGSGYSKPVSPAPGSGAQRQAATGQTASRPGMLGGMGGMFGGLLMGGLLGSMLFGGGHGIGGPGLLDMLLLGGGALLLFRFLRARREAAAMQSAGHSSGAQYARVEPEYQPGSGASGASGASGGWGGLSDSRPSAPPRVLPESINEDEFLSGAKAMYNRMQDSWDRRDLEDIRQFVSPEVHAEAARQAASDATPSRTEVLVLEARAVEFRERGDEEIVSVLFDALLREDASASQASQVREVWHVRRSPSDPRWILEGIQQLEA